IDYDHLGGKLHKLMSRTPLAIPDAAASKLEIQKRLDEAVKSGKTTETQAKDLKKKADELCNQLENAAKKNQSLSDDELMSFGLELDALSEELDTMLGADDALALEKRLKDLDLYLGAALVNGTLTPLEVLDFKESLDEQLQTQSKLKSSEKISLDDKQALALEIARLESRLARLEHDPSRLWSGLTVTLSNLSNRNVEALKAKRVSDEDSKTISSELSTINKKLIEGQKSSNAFDSANALALSAELQELSGKLDMAMKDRETSVPDIDALRQSLDARVAQSAVSGELSAADARSAVLTMGEINSVKEKYHNSENELSTREKFALAFELERLYTKIEEQINKSSSLYPGIERRRSQIETLIDDAVSSGRLNAASRDLYESRLQENAVLEKQYRSDSLGLTADKSLELISSLERLYEQLDRELREKQIILSEIVSLEANVERKIRRAFCSGLLSLKEAEVMRASYDEVVRVFNKMRAENGGLSYGERLAFEYEFQRMAASVERNQRTESQELPDFSAQRAYLEQTLGSLLASGRLSLKDSGDLKVLLDEIVKGAALKRESAGGMSYQESLLVAVDVERLDHLIESRVAAQKAPLSDLDKARSELALRLEAAKAGGNLSPAQYKEFKAELEKIDDNEADFRISDESLNYAEARNLFRALEALKSKLETAPAKQSSQKKSRAKKEISANPGKKAAEGPAKEIDRESSKARESKH
ncbi:MAG: hypothetical protein K2X27_14525, partial [Candidatus Obscuribacterales bacterium]|nr:hypothetical protein [Candidatus Obscuribacterales bacterium]